MRKSLMCFRCGTRIILHLRRKEFSGKCGQCERIYKMDLDQEEVTVVPPRGEDGMYVYSPPIRKGLACLEKLK